MFSNTREAFYDLKLSLFLHACVRLERVPGCAVCLLCLHSPGAASLGSRGDARLGNVCGLVCAGLQGL